MSIANAGQAKAGPPYAGQAKAGQPVDRAPAPRGRPHPPRRTLRRKRGQGMTEYIVIVAVVAVAAIAVYQFLGKTIRNQVAAIATELAGQTDTSSTRQAAQAADGARREAERHRTLATYDGNARAGGQ